MTDPQVTGPSEAQAGVPEDVAGVATCASHAVGDEVDLFAPPSPYEPAWEPFRALYIHVPFCASRCRYCDFSTEAAAADDPRLDAYVEDMVRDIRRAYRAGLLGEIETVYLGGGTPTRLGAGRLSELLYALSLSMHLTSEVECSMEANPESVDARLVRDVYALGVNRISLGVQTFDDALLKRLGRVHDRDTALRAIDAVAERFENYSVDLMCGLPGQTMDGFLADLDRAIELGVPHVSVYPLAIEEHTPFGRDLAAGRMDEPDADLQADMLAAARKRLATCGYVSYEVASHAKPGHACRHNLAYWSGAPYLGLGPGAVTMRQRGSVADLAAAFDPSDVSGRIQREGGSPTCVERLVRERVLDGRVQDVVTGADVVLEDLVLAMRRDVGADPALLALACAVAPGLEGYVRMRTEQGLLVRGADGSVALSDRGREVANDLWADLLDLGADA